MKKHHLLAVSLAMYGIAATAAAMEYPKTAGAFTRNEGMIGGRMRSYFTYEPRGLKPGAALLFVFHGGGGDGGEAREGSGGEYEALADRFRFVVAYPNGVGMSWNGCRKLQNQTRARRGIDDVGFVDAMIAAEIARHHIDPKRVFATGHSNGGALAFRLALERADKFAGIAAISSNLPAPDNMECAPMPRPMPVLIMNGTADPVNPYNGGTNGRGTGFGRTMSTDQTVQFFAAINGLQGPPDIARLPHVNNSDRTSVDRVTWSAQGKPSVVLYTINGGGHVVPQRHYRFPRVVGPQTEDVDAPEVIWDFFMKETGMDSGLAAEQVQ